MCTWVGDYYIRSKSWCWKTWSIDNIENHPSVDGRIWRPANRPVINSNPFFVFRKFAPIVSLLHASIILYNFFFFPPFLLFPGYYSLFLSGAWKPEVSPPQPTPWRSRVWRNRLTKPIRWVYTFFLSYIY